MIRLSTRPLIPFATTLAANFLAISILVACGTPNAPAPVIYRGDGPKNGSANNAPRQPARDESVPAAAPTTRIDSQELGELEPPEAPDAAFEQGEVVSAKTRPASIKVVKGDTLFSLSEKYQIALKPLIELNDLKAPYALNVGQMLKLPPPLHYRVRKGDTVMAISRRFSLDFRSLALINGIEPPFALYTDDILVLPALARGADGQWTEAAPSAAVQPKAGAVSGGKKPAVKAPATSPAKSSAASKPRAPATNSTFAWPIKGKIVSKFGAKPGGTRNDGINIAAAQGAVVRAAGAGTVVYAGSELKSFGNLILVRHSNGWVSAYAHNSKLLVKEGAQVKTGDSLAEVGSTGSVDTPQLHFETRRGRTPVDPALHLPKTG